MELVNHMMVQDLLRRLRGVHFLFLMAIFFLKASLLFLLSQLLFRLRRRWQVLELDLRLNLVFERDGQELDLGRFFLGLGHGLGGHGLGLGTLGWTLRFLRHVLTHCPGLGSPFGYELLRNLRWVLKPPEHSGQSTSSVSPSLVPDCLSMRPNRLKDKSRLTDLNFESESVCSPFDCCHQQPCF